MSRTRTPSRDTLDLTDFPVLGDVAEPVDAGGFEGGVGVEAAGHGPVDDGLLLLVQHLNQPPSIANEPADPGGVGVKVIGDGLLLFTRRRAGRHPLKVLPVEPVAILDDAA